MVIVSQWCLPMLCDVIYHHDMVHDECYVHFLDCRGYYDLAAQIANLLLSMLTLFLAVRNCRALMQERWRSNEQEVQASRRRKLSVNVFNIIFVCILIIEILYSIIFFFVIHDARTTKIGRGVGVGYKLIEILCVLSLNGLIISVGFLYWRALRIFFEARLQNNTLLGGPSMIPKQLPRLYDPRMIWYFYGLYVYNGMSFVASIVMLLVTDNPIDDGNFAITGYIGLSATVPSMLTFFLARWNYYRQLLKSVQMNESSLRKESLLSFLIVVACLVRLALDLGHIIQGDFQDNFRHYDSMCHDVKAYHALYIFFLTASNSIMPAVIFTHIFKGTQSTQTFNQEDAGSSFF